MKKRSWILFAFYLLSVSRIVAQQDTLYTDTVIVKKPPVVITRQVHVSEPEGSQKRGTSLEAGLYYGIHQNVAPTSQSVTGIFQTSGIQIRYHTQDIEIGTGIGLLTTSLSSHLLIQTQSQQTTYNIKQDTLDCYVIGGTKKVCDVQTDTVKEQRTVPEISSTTQKAMLHYIQVPLSLGYAFHHTTWNFTPSLQLSYNKYLGKQEDIVLMQNQFWLVGGNIGIGKRIGSHFMIEVKGQYQHNLSPVYSDAANPKENWSLFGLIVGCLYRF